MITSKLTTKFQATIPAEIRKLLKLKAGDQIIFSVSKDKVVEVKKASKIDKAYLKGLEKNLSEWESEHDEKAFRNL